MKILIKNGNLINPFGEHSGAQDVLIDNGTVVKIDKNLSDSADKVIDACGLDVLPAFVDMHTHLREPGFEYSEDIYSGSQAAANGGYASVACMPNTNPVNDNVSVTSYILNKAKTAKCKVYPIGSITKNLEGKEISEMGFLKQAGCVAFSDDGKSVEHGGVMRNALLYAKGLDALIISHCEDLSIRGDGVMNEGYYSTVLGLKGIPRAAEEAILARDILLAKSYDCKIHIAHVSTRAGLEIIRNAKKQNVCVTAETCPHYFAADDSFVEGFDTNTKVNPPLRTKDDVQAVMEALQDGTIDAIATDHAPHHPDYKNVEYQLASFGISGLDIAFSLANTYLNLSLEKLVELMSKNPAKILNIHGGEISLGKCADIAIVDKNAEYILTKKDMKSKSKNTPFLNKSLKGRVVYTLCNGNITKEL